jgi:putative transposase
MISFKGRHHQQGMILQCVRWYVAYSLSYRDLEELMQERGYEVDHSTIQRWVVYYAPRIERAFRKSKKRIGLRWRLDESVLQLSCVKDEGRPFGIALQEEISNHHKLH